jgi:hypothetical protein
MAAENLGSLPDLAFDHPTHMSCVYAISGTYGLLPRILYYATLVFAIFGRTREWLIVGALVSALTYGGTSAIHQMALVTSRDPVYDLDILGAWAILSTGALAFIVMMHWSSTVRNTDAMLILIIWGVLVGVALIFGRAELFNTPLADPEPACYSSAGQLLVYPVELVSPLFNCTYKCFSAHTAMRQQSEVMAVPRKTLENYWTGLSVVLIGPIQFAAYAALSAMSLSRSPSGICTFIVMKYLEPQQHEEILKHIYEASENHIFGGYFALFHFARRSRWSARKAIIYFFTLPWFVMALVIDIFALPLMVINIVLNELSINKPQLPVNEANYAIGQWGPVAASVLVIIASLIRRGQMWYGRRVETAKQRKEEAAKINTEPRHTTVETFELADGTEGQQVGVVKRGIGRVLTLKDTLEDWRMLR